MSKYIKDSFNKNYSLSISFNIYFLLFSVNFLSYSIYAALSSYNIFIIELIISLNFIVFYYLYKKHPKENIFYNINLYNYEIIFFLVLTLFLILLLFNEISIPISMDEVAYSRRSVRTSLFASIIFLNFIDINYLKTIPIKHIIHFLNLFHLIFIFLILYSIKRFKNLKILFLILTLNIILRLVLKDATDHPPLNHIFSTFLSSFLGLNHYVFKLSYLIPYIFFLFLIFSMMKEKIGNKTSLLLITSVATFPLLLLSSVTPDHSLWGCLFFTIILFYVCIYENINYKLIFLIISIGILFRISIFSAFFLIGSCFLIDSINKKSLFINKGIFLIINDKLPLIALVFIPVLSINLFGTSVFEGLDGINFLEKATNIFNSKIILFTFLKQVPFWYYIFIFFCLVSSRRIEIFIFFVCTIFVYFSIDETMWGFAKYTLEYAIPFTLVGYFIFIKFLINKKKIILANLISILIIILNVHDIYKFPKSNTPYDIIYEDGFFLNTLLKDGFSKKTKYLLKLPFRYDDAYDYITINKIRENTLMLGTDYGFLPQIIEGYNFLELKKIIELKSEYRHVVENNNSNYGKFDQILKIKKNYKINNDHPNNILKSINSIKNLHYILLADKRLNGSKKNLIENMIANNWTIKKKFIEKDYKITLFLLEKREK